MDMDLEMDQIRDIFFEEAREHLESMESSLLELEAGGSADAATLNAIFRSAHTIKGGSGMFGMDDMTRFTHSLENLLDQVRGGVIPMTSPLVDVLLRSCDVLKGLLASARQNGASPPEMEGVLSDLQRANAVVPQQVEAVGVAEPGHHAASLVSADSMSAGSTQAVSDDVRGVDMPLDAATGQSGHVPAPVAANVIPAVTSGSAPSEALKPPPLEKPPGGGESGAPSAAPVASESSSTIRVDVDLLDRLMNQVGELVLARNQILQFSNVADNASLTAASQRLNLITSELQEGVMKTRMQPIGVAWSMMPRLVRDLAHSCGKQIQLEMVGAETELDRTIIDAIKDPLTHLVRNSCDHGLEAPPQREARGKAIAGTLLLRAFHEGGHVIIEISDDGGGVDIAKVKNKALERHLITPEHAARMSEREAANLIFLPGFSTAERVSNISGRGVGMDVVKTNIDRIGGTVDLTNRPGQGTTVRIKIPLTLAIIPGMVVEGGGERFVIHQVSLVELVRMEEEHARERIERIHGAPVCRLRGRLLPLVHLNEILGDGQGQH